MNLFGILKLRLAGRRTTGRYPAHDEPLPPAFRGIPELAAARCRGAGECAAVCPTGAVQVQRSDGGWRWMLDAAACIGCGLCIETCPHTALAVLPSYELASRTRRDLVTSLTFVHDPIVADEARR